LEGFFMRHLLKILFLSWALIFFIGCSSSDTAYEGDDLFDDDSSYFSADTDFLPQDDMEFFDSGDDYFSSDPIPLPEPEPPAPSYASDYNFNTPQMTTPVGSGETVQYTVRSGDTLMKIAFEHYGDLYRWQDIYHANRDKISNPNQIARGTTLRIEGATRFSAPHGTGEVYAIQKGDTLGTISNKVYGTPSKWRDLWDNNREMIRDPNKIYAGFNLYYVPGSSTPRYSPDPIGQTDFNQPVTSGTSSFDDGYRDPSSAPQPVQKNKPAPAASAPPPAPEPAVDPDSLWNDADDDAGFTFD
jgi:LysM repeat protein